MYQYRFRTKIHCMVRKRYHLVSISEQKKRSRIRTKYSRFGTKSCKIKHFVFAPKKYFDFAPNHFLLYRSDTKMITFVSIWHQNGNVSTPKMLCISNAFAPQFTAWCENVTIYFQNRQNKKGVWCENEILFGAKTRCFILQDLVPKRECLVDENNKFKLIAKTIYSSVDNIQQHLKHVRIKYI